MTRAAANGHSRVTSSGTDSGRDLPVLPDVGLIALVPDAWDATWQSRHYVLTRLARYFHVVWCNPTAVNDRSDDQYAAARGDRAAGGEVPASFTVHNPPSWASAFRFQRPAAFAGLVIQQRYRGARRHLAIRGCDRVLLSLWRPYFARALDAIPHHVSCYHIDDEYTFSDIEQATDEREASLIRRVDQVFVSSRGLLDKKGHLNPSTLFVPNGVDYAAYVASSPEPADLQPIPHPRLGYVGLIKRQLDLELLYALARRHPTWSFVLVGPQKHREHIGASIEKLMQLPNVHFLGEKPVGELPAYTQHIDVCLLCYKVDDYTKFIYPLKLNESLASGRPCVGSPIRTLQEFSSVLDLARTEDEWSEAIATALTPSRRSEACSAARREVARRHDWDLLVHQIATALCDKLGPSYRQRLQQSMPESRVLASGSPRERR